MLAHFFEIYFQTFFKEPLAIDASHADSGGPVSRPPVLSYRPSGRPFFQAELPGIRFIRCIRVFLNSGPMSPRRRRKTRRSYLALAGLYGRWFLVEAQAAVLAFAAIARQS